MAQLYDSSSDFGSSDHRTSDEQFEYLGLPEPNTFAAQTEFPLLKNTSVSTESPKMQETSIQTYPFCDIQKNGSICQGCEKLQHKVVQLLTER